MQRLMFLVAMAILLGAPMRVAAEAPLSPADRADVQCLAIVFAIFGSDPDMAPEQQLGLASGAMYYLGRLQGRTPDVDWLARLVTYLESAPEADFKTEQQRCGQEMIATGAALIEWGEATQKRYGPSKP